MSYITSTVPELSGLCYSNGVLYGVSDDLKNSNSGIYTINKDTGETSLFVSIDADLEGITCDPDGNLYVCTEDELNEDLTHKTWGDDAVTTHTSTILKITLDKEVSLMGTYVNEASEQNKGLEGIAYYDSVDGEPRFLIGNLKKPIVLMLWSKSQGIISQLTLTSEDSITRTSEIADLYYDGLYLYILDSKTAIVYKYSVEYNTDLSITLIVKLDISDVIDMSTALNDGDGENPESLTFIDGVMYIGCDYNSKIYSFTDNLSNADFGKVTEEVSDGSSSESSSTEESIFSNSYGLPSTLKEFSNIEYNSSEIIKIYYNTYLVYTKTNSTIITDSVIASGLWQNDSLWSNDDLYSNNSLFSNN